MRDPLDPIEKLKLSDAIKVRVLPEFRERVVSVAMAEGIGLAEFTRRAIVERVRRLEAVEAGTDQPPTSASTSPPSPVAPHAHAATSLPAEAPAPAADKPRRRGA